MASIGRITCAASMSTPTGSPVAFGSGAGPVRPVEVQGHERSDGDRSALPGGVGDHRSPGSGSSRGLKVGTAWSYLVFCGPPQHARLGKGVLILPHSAGDEIMAYLPKEKVHHLRVPYPLGFYTRGVDGRIDDERAGWKGRGGWSTTRRLSGTRDRRGILQMRRTSRFAPVRSRSDGCSYGGLNLRGKPSRQPLEDPPSDGERERWTRCRATSRACSTDRRPRLHAPLGDGGGPGRQFPTGLRIARLYGERGGRSVRRLDWLPLKGAVIDWHTLSGWSLTFVAIAYAAFLGSAGGRRASSSMAGSGAKSRGAPRRPAVVEPGGLVGDQRPGH
jgi:hypothetical protein